MTRRMHFLSMAGNDSNRSRVEKVLRRLAKARCYTSASRRDFFSKILGISASDVSLRTAHHAARTNTMYLGFDTIGLASRANEYQPS